MVVDRTLLLVITLIILIVEVMGRLSRVSVVGFLHHIIFIFVIIILSATQQLILIIIVEILDSQLLISASLWLTDHLL